MRVINRKLLFFLGVFLWMACGPRQPESMARQYCECFKAAEAGTQKLEECQELLNTHRERLGKDPSLSKRYADELLKCAVYNRDTEGEQE